MRNFLMLLGLVAATACSSGFVDGWVDRDNAPRGTEEEQCARTKGHTWVNGQCANTADLNLADIASEDQCNQIPEHGWFNGQCLDYRSLTEPQCADVIGWAWFEGQCRPGQAIDCMADPLKIFADGACLDRPTLTVEGARTQTTAIGTPIQPLKLTMSGGAAAKLRAESCPGFLHLEGNQLVSKEGFEVNGGQSTCTADLVAIAGPAESQPVKIAITMEPGFYSACLKKHPSAEAIKTARLLTRAPELEKPDCEQTTKALKELKSIRIENAGIRDISVLVGLTKLERLNLAGNRVEDLAALASLQNLNGLDLTGNDVKSVAALAKLPKLNFLYLDGTPLAKGEVAKTRDNCPTGEGVNAQVADFCAP